MSHHRRRSTVRVALIAATAPVLFAVACTPDPPAAPVPTVPAAANPTSTTTAPEMTTVPLTTIRSATGPGFNTTIRFAATMPTAQVQPTFAAINAAAANWERVITGDVTNTLTSSFTGCTGAGPVGPIDDIVIDVTVAPGDGVGGVLGSAGWCTRRGTIPLAGSMTFDSADIGAWLQSNRFDRVVTHEMGHVLGIGTMWSFAGYLNTSSPSDPRFTGPNAVAAWNRLSGNTDTGVPVEATGGTGTALAHWRESTFRSEIMTGWISLGASPLSTVSVASLADLGYTVDLTQADPYVLGSLIDAATPNVDAHHDGDPSDAHGAGAGFLLTTDGGPIGTD